MEHISHGRSNNPWVKPQDENDGDQQGRGDKKSKTAILSGSVMKCSLKICLSDHQVSSNFLAKAYPQIHLLSPLLDFSDGYAAQFGITGQRNPLAFLGCW